MQNLEEQFLEVLNADFKDLPEKVTTLFDIAEFPERERVISNFYAYYFNPAAEHGFKDLFVAALSKLIVIKTGSEEIIENYAFCEVHKEVRTEKGNFIDIVIYESSSKENAIIIENKINATLYNDLTDYYKSISVKSKKIGVVLSLKKETTLPKEFINITHFELVTKVEQASGYYFLHASPKQLVILKEFIQNMKSMAISNELSEQYNFYFKYEDKIRKLTELRDAIVEDVFRQADEACEKLEMNLKLKATNTESLRFFVSSRDPSVYFKLWLKDLMADGEYMCIVVELNAEGMKYLDKINQIKFTEDERSLLKETTKLRKGYLQYAGIPCTSPTAEEIKNFTDYIYSQITNTPLKSIFLKIENCLAELETSNEKL